MKFSHFNAFKPICPLCLRDRSNKSFLEINLKFRETKEGIAEGILGCPNPVCRCEYPIIDGIPIIVPDIRTYISTNILPIIERKDLSGEMLSLLGDCCGPGSVFDRSRQHLSIYAYDHYGDLDPHEDKIGGTPPGSVLRLLKRGLSLVPGVAAAGPVIDMGCAVGRTTFELAETFEGLILGVDLSFDMLRLAASVMNNGEVTYPRREVGLVYDLRRFKVRFKESARIDFWAVDATVLPFPDNTFGFAASLNHLGKGAVQGHPECTIAQGFTQAARDLQLFGKQYRSGIRAPPQNRLTFAVPGEYPLTVGVE